MGEEPTPIISLEDFFTGELLLNAITAGIDYSSYWELTYGEIMLHIKAYNRKRLDDMKLQATMNHSLANLIGLSVARIMDSKSHYPTLFEAYPTLFAEEAEREERIRQENEWKLYKARIMEYSMSHNKKIKESR